MFLHEEYQDSAEAKLNNPAETTLGAKVQTDNVTMVTPLVIFIITDKEGIFDLKKFISQEKINYLEKTKKY
jgi:hypothetical protein